MSERVGNNFYQGLRMPPDGSIHEATVFDELRWALQWQKTGVARTCQAVSQFHGPYVGSSPTMATIVKAVEGVDHTLQSLARTANDAVDLVNQTIYEVENIAGLINNITCAEMTTPFLRHFITECQVLHPDVTSFIHNNINQFPYFQKVAESIGTHFTIISDCNMIDPLFTLSCLDLPTTNLKAAARMTRSLFTKMFEATAGTMENAQNLLDTLTLRAMPYEDNHGFVHPHSAVKGAIAHGLNYCMDTFHQLRSQTAIPGVFVQLLNHFGDRLRLLNQIFPVEYRVKHEEKLYEIQVEGQPNTVDRLNRQYPGREADIDRSLKATQQTFDGDDY